MDRESLSLNRSKIIEDFIEIETLISVIITTHYLGRADVNAAIQFMREIFFDEQCSFAFKVNILEKVINKGLEYLSLTMADGKNGVDKLKELARIRNKFAHCGPAIEVKRNEAAVKVTPHPKRVNEDLDFDEEYQKFTVLQPTIRQWLETTKKDLDAYIAKR